MNVDEIRRLMHAQPLRPFLVRISDGSELLVRHPDFVAIGPNSFLVSIYDETGLNVTSILQIAGIHVPEASRRE